MKSINFVSKRQKSLSKQQLVDQKYLYVAVAIFLVLVLLTLATLISQWLIFSKLESVKAETESLQSQILASEDKENAFIVLVHKLEAISKVMAERQKRQEAVDYFSSVFGSEVLVEEMHYEEQQQQLLIFKLVSRDVFVLETVMEKLQSAELRAKYAQLKFSSLDRSEKANYELTITVTL